MPKRIAKRVLVIGWDAADWKAINPLIDQGKMPALERFINEGVMGNLATLQPMLSPMLWTSIATGVRPYRHGIHGFTEPDPHTGGIRPITTASRSVKAIWNILNQNGMKSNVIGWWPSHPAEPINGVMVSNRYQRAGAPIDKPWPVMPGTIHPERLIEDIAKLRVHPGELEAEQILPFVPKAADIDQDKDKRLESVAKIIADCSSIHACATACIQLEEWDFMGVYYDAIDHFGHGFMKYHPPKQDHVSQKDFDLYSEVVESGYRFHDMMLGTLMHLAGDDTTIIIVSDHGFYPDNMRPKQIPLEPAGPAAEHSPYGIVAMRGPGIKKDELIYGSTLLDITPTILTLFGLPVGEDMQGKPLVQAFAEKPEITTIPSWNDVEGDDGAHPPDAQMDPVEAAEAVKQLVALGYIEDPGQDKDEAVRQTVRELRYNLAQDYIDDNRNGEALPILLELWNDWPEELRFANRLASCYYSLGLNTECRKTIEELLKTQKRLAIESRKTLKKDFLPKLKLIREAAKAKREAAEAKKKADEGKSKEEIELEKTMADAKSDIADAVKAALPVNIDGDESIPAVEPAPPAQPDVENVDDAPDEIEELIKESEDVAEAVVEREEGEPVPEGQEDDSIPKFTPKEQRDLRRLRALANPPRYGSDYLLGFVMMAERRYESALEHLKRAEKARPRLPYLHNQLGHNFLRLKKPKNAERSFKKAIKIDPENAQSYLGLAMSQLAKRENMKAADSALTAVGLLYSFPRAHYYLGIALHRIGKVDKAIEALKVAISQNPNFEEAHKRLAYIYKYRLKNTELAADHKDMVREIRDLRRDQRKEAKVRVREARARAREAAKKLKAQKVEKAAAEPEEDNELTEGAAETPNKGVRMVTPIGDDFITIVTGLPRSGTSMMMQMLDAGGLECLTDHERKADEDNPKGYFEFERAKKLRTDPMWLPEAQGKAVKIVAPLLPYLRGGFEYRIIFMERPMDEIMASQRTMLERMEKDGAALTEARLRSTFEQQLRQVDGLLKNRKIKLLRVPYHAALEEPTKVAEDLRAFIGKELNPEKMSATVDKSLYRHRK